MKDLVLHVGLPKAGSTTLQNGWFVPLHEDGLINYIGRAKYRDSTDTEFIDIADYFGNSTLSIDNMHNEIEYTGDVTNVISTENFTYPQVQREINSNDGKWAAPTDPYAMPKILFETFSEHFDNITIVIIPRNQTDIIHSSFTHHYRYTYEQRWDSWDNFLNFILDEKKTIFDYGEISSEYAKYFGEENVEPLFFEDLVNNKEEFAENIAGIIGTDIEDFFESAEIDSHYNKKPNQSDTSFARGAKYTRLHNILKNSDWPIKAQRAMESMIGRDRVTKLLDYVYYEKTKQFDNVSSEQRNRILNRYNQTNKKLNDHFGLDRTKLKRYSYLR
jgi:hypothetical protein